MTAFKNDNVKNKFEGNREIIFHKDTVLDLKALKYFSMLDE